MKRLVAIIWLFGLAAPLTANAHPGSGIAVDRAGRVYFVQYGSSRIMRLDHGRVSVFVDDDRIRIPHHLVIDADDNLYTVSDDDSRVWKISPQGALTLVYAPRGPDAPRVGAWGDPFTIDTRGAIYYVPQGRGRIFRLVAGVAEPFADTTFRFGDLHGATMTWGPDGALYITDRTRVVRIAPNGAVAAVGGDDAPRLGLAMGVAVDPSATVYVADYVAGRVLRIPPSGKTTTLGGTRFVRPTGVTIGPDGAVYVLDRRVWRIAPDGGVTLLACLSRVPKPVELAIVLLPPLLLALWMWMTRRTALRDRVLRVILSGIVMIPLYVFARGGCTSPYAGYAVYALLVAAAVASLAGVAVRSSKPAVAT